MRSLIIATAAICSFASASHAVTTLPLLPQSGLTIDQTFNMLCGGQACEQIVPEMRIGSAAGGSGTYEYNFQADGQFNFQGLGRDFPWQNGVETQFSISYVGGMTNTLSLMVGTNMADQIMVDLSQTNAGSLSPTITLFIRTSNFGGGNDPNGASVMLLSEMMLNGMSIPPVSSSGGNPRQVSYLQVFDFDWTQDWTLDGNVFFAWDGFQPSQSQLASQFKFTDLNPVPIPLPAPVLMLGAALSGLGLMRLRRKRS
ncbi:MAG: VPLPA-CTERM sorting domain-containing protein [Pseudomonadota bacterium]